MDTVVKILKENLGPFQALLICYYMFLLVFLFVCLFYDHY